MADTDLRDAVDAAITAVDTHDPQLHASVAAIGVALQAVAPLLIEQGRRQVLDAMHTEFIGDDCAEWTHVDQINDFINKQRTGHRG